mgnify:CR=1 FL=1
MSYRLLVIDLAKSREVKEGRAGEITKVKTTVLLPGFFIVETRVMVMMIGGMAVQVVNKVTGSMVQLKWGSITHAVEQPSPLMMLPSSQASVGTMVIPSEQKGTHMLELFHW